jgi:CRISPR-associated exonuclease Cas4
MTTGTQIHYYHLCHRKLWLFSNGIQMEQDSALVAEGKFIHETTYTKRAEKYKELDFGYVKIDHYDAQNKVIHEVKKSNKLEFVHIAQLKYYLFVLLENGIEGATGILEYPKTKQTKKVVLEEGDISNIQNWKVGVEQIISAEKCPELVRKPYCKACAYYEYCFI